MEDGTRQQRVEKSGPCSGRVGPEAGGEAAPLLRGLEHPGEDQQGVEGFHALLGGVTRGGEGGLLLDICILYSLWVRVV